MESRTSYCSLGAIAGPEQVPTVSLDIKEYRHPAIRFDARSGDESDSCRDHPSVHRLEIIDTKEEPDSACKLLTNDRGLMVAVGACEQNTRVTSGGANDDPPFWPTIVRHCRSVLHEVELEDSDKEINRRFVLPHDQGDELEM